MPKEKSSKAKDGAEPPTKRQRKDRRERKERKNGKEVIPAGGGEGEGGGGGAGPRVRNRSSTPSFATESESSYSDSSFTSTTSFSFSSSTSSSSSSSDSDEEPEGSTRKPDGPKPSCCRHRHYHRHRRHHHSSRHPHRRCGRGSCHHRSAHGRSTKRSSRKGRRGATHSSTKAPLVIKEEAPAAQAILIPDPIPLPVPAPIPAVLATHPHPQPHPQPVPAPALAPAPAPAPVPAPGHALGPVAKPAPQTVPMEHHHRKTRVRSSGSGLQNLIPATSSHNQAVFQSNTVTVTKSTATPTAAPTAITMPSDDQTMGNSSEGKIKVGGARSSGTKIPLANAMASKSANQVKTTVACSSSKALAKPVNPNSSHSNVNPPTGTKNPETCKIRTSNNERPRRGPTTPTGPAPKRQWDDERSDGYQWKQRRNRSFEGSGGGGGGGDSGGIRVERRGEGGDGGGGGTDTEDSQVAYRNGKPTIRFRQPVRIVRLHIKGLTRQVTKEHITEIFGHFGALTAVDFPMDRYQRRQGRDYAFVEYARPEDCACAIKHMNGGLIDGKRVTVSAFQERMLKAPWSHYRRYSPVNRRQRHNLPSHSRSRSHSLSRFLSRSRSPNFSRSRTRSRSRSRSRYNRRYRTPSRSRFSHGRSSPHYQRTASRSP